MNKISKFIQIFYLVFYILCSNKKVMSLECKEPSDGDLKSLLDKSIQTNVKLFINEDIFFNSTIRKDLRNIIKELDYENYENENHDNQTCVAIRKKNEEKMFEVSSLCPHLLKSLTRKLRYPRVVTYAFCICKDCIYKNAFKEAHSRCKGFKKPAPGNLNSTF